MPTHVTTMPIERRAGAVEYMGEFMGGGVVTIFLIGQPEQNALPGEDHGSPVMRFAEDPIFLTRAPKGFGVHDDLGQAVVVGDVQMQNEPHCRSRDDDTHLVIDLLAPRTDEVLLPCEDLEMVEEALAKRALDVAEEGDTVLEMRQPGLR